MAKQARKIQRSNGAKNGASVPKIDTATAGKLRSLDQRLASLKQALGEAELQCAVLDDRKRQIISAIAAANTELQEAAKSAIEPFKKSEDDRFNIDLQSMVVTKMESGA